jgi:hypothetical protein
VLDLSGDYPVTTRHWRSANKQAAAPWLCVAANSKGTTGAAAATAAAGKAYSTSPGSRTVSNDSPQLQAAQQAQQQAAVAAAPAGSEGMQCDDAPEQQEQPYFGTVTTTATGTGAGFAAAAIAAAAAAGSSAAGVKRQLPLGSLADTAAAAGAAGAPGGWWAVEPAAAAGGAVTDVSKTAADDAEQMLQVEEVSSVVACQRMCWLPNGVHVHFVPPVPTQHLMQSSFIKAYVLCNKMHCFNAARARCPKQHH